MQIYQWVRHSITVCRIIMMYDHFMICRTTIFLQTQLQLHPEEVSFAYRDYGKFTFVFVVNLPLLDDVLATQPNICILKYLENDCSFPSCLECNFAIKLC